jgi:hypothetical protein
MFNFITMSGDFENVVSNYAFLLTVHFGIGTLFFAALGPLRHPRGSAPYHGARDQ